MPHTFNLPAFDDQINAGERRPQDIGHLQRSPLPPLKGEPKTLSMVRASGARSGMRGGRIVPVSCLLCPGVLAVDFAEHDID
jgi:hypothetical protein